MHHITFGQIYHCFFFYVLPSQKHNVEYGSRPTSIMNVAHQISPLDIIILNGSQSPY
jgi:hypothetical protein